MLVEAMYKNLNTEELKYEYFPVDDNNYSGLFDGIRRYIKRKYGVLPIRMLFCDQGHNVRNAPKG